MIRILVVLIAIAGCTQFDVLTEAASDEGTVYSCSDGSASKELCFLDSAAKDLAAELGDGWACETTDRWWPRLTNAIGAGCNYHCPHLGPGCNAKNGCWCP